MPTKRQFHELRRTSRELAECLVRCPRESRPLPYAPLKRLLSLFTPSFIAQASMDNLKWRLAGREHFRVAGVKNAAGGDVAPLMLDQRRRLQRILWRGGKLSTLKYAAAFCFLLESVAKEVINTPSTRGIRIVG